MLIFAGTRMKVNVEGNELEQGDHVMLSPHLPTTQSELDTILDTFETSVKNVMGRFKCKKLITNCALTGGVPTREMTLMFQQVPRKLQSQPMPAITQELLFICMQETKRKANFQS